MTNEQYFESQPSSPSARRTFRVALPDGVLNLLSDNGVFSQHRLDIGTRILLLRAGPLPEHAEHLLDLGCGIGPIALTMAKRRPAATIWAIDVNQRALELCRENAEANGVTNIRICTTDGVPDDILFDAIWSNPPIHIGKQALHELLLAWLPRLSNDGAATMVVQKHLGSDSLQTWLQQHGYPTERLGSAKGYRLLRSVRAH